MQEFRRLELRLLDIHLGRKELLKVLRSASNLAKLYALANQGINISSFNTEVDKHNAWVQQNFGNDPNLMLSKMPMPDYSNVPSISNKPIHAMDASFNQSAPSDLRSWLSNVLALTVRCLPVQFFLPKFPSWLSS